MKIFIRTILVFFVVAFLIIGFFSSKIRTEEIKPLLQAALKKDLHADINFDNLRFFPLRGELVLTHVTLKNEGSPFDSVPILSADSVVLKPQWLRMFMRDLAFDVEVGGAQLTLVSAQGKTNFRELFANPQEEKASIDSPATEGQQLVGAAETAPVTAAPFEWFREVSIASLHLNQASLNWLKKDISNNPVSLGVAQVDIRDIEKRGILHGKADLDFSYSNVDVKAVGKTHVDFSVEPKGETSTAIVSLDLGDLDYSDRSVKKPAGVALRASVIAEHKSLHTWLFQVEADFEDGKIDVKGDLNADDSVAVDLNGAIRSPKFFNETGFLGSDFSESAHFDFDGKLKGSWGRPQTYSGTVEIKEVVEDSDLSVSVTLTDGLMPKFEFVASSQNFSASDLLLPFAKKEIAASPVFKLEGKNFEMSGSREGYLVSIDFLKLEAFDGNLEAKGKMEMTSGKPFEALVKLQGVQIDKVLAVVRKSDSLGVRGVATADISLNAESSGAKEFADSVVGHGKFSVSQLAVPAAPLRGAIQRELAQSIAKFSSETASAKLLDEANKLLVDPQLKKFAQQNNIDIERYRQKYLALGEVTLGDVPGEDAQPMRGSFEITDQKIHFSVERHSGDGDINAEGVLGFEDRIDARGQFVGSKTFNNALSERSHYSKYLLDDKGAFVLPFQVNGSLSSPIFSFNLDSINANLHKNAERLTDSDLEADIKVLSEQLSKKLKNTRLYSQLKRQVEGTPSSGSPSDDSDPVEEALKKAIQRGKERLKKYLKK